MVIEVVGADGSLVFLPAQFIESMLIVDSMARAEIGVAIRTVSGAGFTKKFGHPDEAREFIGEWLCVCGEKKAAVREQLADAFIEPPVIGEGL
jgi:hypothetical protein